MGQLLVPTERGELNLTYCSASSEWALTRQPTGAHSPCVHGSWMPATVNIIYVMSVNYGDPFLPPTKPKLPANPERAACDAADINGTLTLYDLMRPPADRLLTIC